MIALLILAIAFGLYQGVLFIAGLVLIAQSGGRVTIGLLPGFISVLLFVVYFTL